MTQDEIKALAKQAGGTAYVNRHYPGATAVAFGPAALVEFVRLVQEQPHTDHPLRHFDRTCPGCLEGEA